MRKMKNLKLYILLAILASFAMSCSLDEEPYGFVSSDKFYKTADDAESGIFFAYATLAEKTYYDRYFYIVTEVSCESMTLKDGASVDQHDIDRLKADASNEALDYVWRAAYSGINRANIVIENVEEVNMDIDYRNQLLGEAYFLRALHHFNLVQFFGDVVIRDNYVDDAAETDLGVSSREDVYAIIESDLKIAEERMDVIHRAGRANKIAAQALLAKVYLTMASASANGVQGYEFVTSADEYYTNARDYAVMVTNNQAVYSFVDDQKDIWGDTNEYNTEFIFQVAHDKSGTEEGEWTQLPLLLTPYNGDVNITLPDGRTMRRGWEHIQTEPAFYSNWPDNDLRKTEMIANKIIVEGVEKTYPGGGLPFPFTLKFAHPNSNDNKCDNDFPVLRYSDILLVLAEAAGPTSEGYEAINKIRLRAGLSDLAGGLSVTDFREKVFEERTYEMAFEGMRLFDLRRLKKMEKVLVEQYGKTYTGDLYEYPIPQNEVNYNDNIN